MTDDQVTTSAAPNVGPMGESRAIMATLRDTTANPGPLGLMAFGMTTVLLNVHNAGLIPLSGIILAMGVFYGGIAQVIAGIMEWKKNSTFGMTAFLSYGLFWLTFVGIFAFPKWMGTADLDLGATATALGYYLFAWGVFTGLMFVGTLRINRSLQTVFLSLTILFLPARPWRVDGQLDADQGGRLGGHLRGPLRGLRLHRPDLERALRARWSPAASGPQK